MSDISSRERRLTQTIADYYVGLDLGQSHDFTALAVVEKTVGVKGFDEYGHYADVWLEDDRVGYSVVHLERFPLGTPYPRIVESVGARVKALPLGGRGTVDGSPPQRILAVDNTGVGRPITDLIKQAGIGDLVVPITIHGGNAVTSEDGYYNVPKRDLVGAIQVLMQQRRLKVASELPEAQTLIKELRDYRYKLTANAHDTYNAREGQHDDLVLALGVAVWSARRGFRDEGMSDEVMEILTYWQ